MDILDNEKIRLMIKDYGAKEVLNEFRKALRSMANEYSDMGLKEQALETIEVAELLSDVHDVID
jgi:hypothetical protein